MKYGKSIAAVVYAVIVLIYQNLSGDGTIEPDEWVSIAIAGVTAVGVWMVPMAPHAKWAKTAVAALLAVLQVMTTSILGGLEPGEWLLLLITLGSALGVYIAPAVTETPNGAPDVVVGVGSDS